MSTIQDKIETAISAILSLIRKQAPIAAALSGGKDSSIVTILFLEAVRRAKQEDINQPMHYITSSTTLTENPRLETHLLEMHREIEEFCEREALPVTVKLVKPALASTFVVSTIGRGTLPRFPDNGASRQCSTDWKYLPQIRFIGNVTRASTAQGYGEPVSLIGTRFSESKARAVRMTEREESATKPVRDGNGRLVLSPIADWSLSDVWDMLELFLTPDARPFPTFTEGQSIYRLFDLYRDANEGTCGIVLGDGGQKSPCGNRMGCWNCTVVNSDKSMESMLANSDKHEFMRGLNAFRNLLMATQYDMSRRELIGRTISDAGYLPVRPDVYSFAFRRQLLAYLLTLDVIERERAEQLEADIFTGRVEDTAENRLMASPQFETVSLEQLVLVDFQWSLTAFAPHAFPAISLWYEINVLGRRYPVPTVEAFPKIPIPEKRWFPVDAFNRDAPAIGLRDFQAEIWNPYRHPDRPFTHRQLGNERMTWFEEADGLEVDAEKACMFVTCEFESMFIHCGQHHASESATFLLNEEIVKLPAGMAGRYQHMAKRGQYFANLMERYNLTPAEMNAHLLANSISDTEHSKLCAERQPANPQVDLFAIAA